MINEFIKESGLIVCGFNPEGEQMLMGSEREWNKYNEMCENLETVGKDEELQMAVNDAQDQIAEGYNDHLMKIKVN